MSAHEHIELDGPPDVAGWSWKQVILAGFFAVAMAINRVANAITLHGQSPTHRPSHESEDA